MCRRYRELGRIAREANGDIIKFLYVTPEKLKASEALQSLLADINSKHLLQVGVGGLGFRV